MKKGSGAFSEDDQGSSALHEDVDASANVLLELGRVPAVTPKNTAGSQDISRVEDQLHPKRTTIKCKHRMVTTPRLPRQRREELRERLHRRNRAEDSFLWRKLYALHSGDAVSPQQFELYSGAPCPICYEDLGVNVPKGTKFDIAVKTCKGNSNRTPN
jgi:hypothetical protein